ncbi:diguanylate cyclase [Litoribacillus peritrichatus]|uniref:diguanylate cyclase n=1 Tax=Litoribacillus peritrichatus TaxID=718191 RepID=A0ABP7MIM6_9GAMM
MPSSHPAKAQSIGKRFYVPRTIASLFGLITVATTFYQFGAPAWYYLGPILQGLFWPHLAYQLARRFAHKGYTEKHSLLMDSFLGGLWVPMMMFNILPLVVLSTTLWLNNISAFGPKFCLKGLLAQAAGVLLGLLLVGLEFNLMPNLAILLSCIPILLIYPIAIATISYKLSKTLSKQKRVLVHLSKHDALTGLYNRGHWEQQLVQEFKNNQTFDEPCCLIFLDIDHFKRINDTYGHSIGDNVLRKIGKIIRDNIRPLDVPGRYGGEEFGIILPETSKEPAIAIAERLRVTIEESLIYINTGQYLEVTASLGVAMLDNTVESYDQWLCNADKALYQAKNSGRNRTVLYECENNRQTPGFA